MKSILAVALLLGCIAAEALAGSIFLTGHDPDFHAVIGGNTTGARNINQTAIGYITDTAFNTFASIGVDKFLFVESFLAEPGGHTQGVNGIVASGYVSGVDFEKHGATTLAAELALLGSKYNSIVVASDFGGNLRQAELDILNANSAAIIAFLNAGGGLYAMAQSNGGAHLTPNGGHFGFLPFIVSSTGLDQTESGFIVTPFGLSLGLANSDVNGNFSHNYFSGTGGLSVVDVDSAGRALSLATRSQISDEGVVPEPGTISLMVSGCLLMGFLAARRARRQTA